MFIALEGLDGAGTTTQLARLAASLRALGREVVETRQPSDGPVGRLVRSALRREWGAAGGRLSPDALALLFAGDRLHHVADVVEPAIARGAVVLTDRYVHSSLAYQGSECDVAWVHEINSRARTADLVVFVEVPVDVCLERIGARGQARELFEERAALEATAALYRQAFALRDEQVVTVDGTGTIDEVERAIREAVTPLLDA